jgi:hypothetical protein|tara:strand:+ start:1455 stop:2276 length:822 start_codon:yes stop_codon:yes gene_type:complete
MPPYNIHGGASYGGYGTPVSSTNTNAPNHPSNYNPPPNHPSNNNQGGGGMNNQGNFPDEGYDDSWESQPNDYVEPYTPPNEIYGSGQTGPGESYEWTHEYGMSGPNINNLIQGLSPQTLSFWNINENSQTIPNELFQMLIEGSIVGDNEEMYNDIDPNTPGIQTEPGVGTWDELEMGNHPSIGGMNNYQDFMGLPIIVPYGDTSSGGSGGGGGGGYGYGYGYGSGNRNGSNYDIDQGRNPYDPEFGRWARSTIQGDFIRSQLKNRGGIISLKR